MRKANSSPSPDRKDPQRTEQLTGSQRGNQIILSWPAPLRNADDGSVQSIRKVNVYRVAERPNSPLPMTEEEFAVRSILVGSVTYDEIRNSGPTLTYTDTLALTEPARLRYALRYVNAAGQRAAFSNFFLMEPAARIAAPPTITGTEKSETANTIIWEAPKVNIDGSTPVNVLGYNVYRSTASTKAPGLNALNGEPITATRYEDKTFKFGEKYVYLVRAVSLGTEGRPVESLDSNSIPLSQEDEYSPSAPSLAPPGAAPGRLALFWSASPEPDVAGYLLYRSTDPNLPKPWILLTQSVHTRTTFTDENVESGKTYYYYVIAVDNNGNKSQPSEVVSDTVP